MLVYTDELPLVHAVAKAERSDPEAARLWVRLGLFEALGDLIDDARPDIDRMVSRNVAKRNAEARNALVRTYIERRIAGQPVDDVLKAAVYLRDITDTVVKADDDEKPHDVSGEARIPAGQEGAGRWTTRGKPGTVESGAMDIMRHLTDKDPARDEQARGIARELQGDQYQRMRVLGNALVSTNNKHAQIAGTLARVGADIGPSAQDVLAPGLRRVAYRYRGTEKRPDAQLKGAVARAAGGASLYYGDNEQRARVQSAMERIAPGDLATGALRGNTMGERHQNAANEDQLRLRATSDVATAHLTGQLPTMSELELSLASGRTPPSVGVIIDRDGQVVSEAMGYQGDHFVPFDLKNLKRLHGGSYVRTRALGGPTSEDIYTGLLTGARQVQVVSRSGVFRVEFDPDLRGGRRYSDKARQMVDRYARIIDVVDRGTFPPVKDDAKPERIYAEDLPASEKRKLRAQAMEDAEYDEDQAKVLYNRALRRARAKASVGFADEDIEADADSQLEEWERNQISAGRPVTAGLRGRQREQIISELKDDARGQGRVRRLELNGEGYFRAMQSLQREFPYFIRSVDYMPLPEFELSRHTKGRDEPLTARSGAPAGSTHVQRGHVDTSRNAAEYGRNARGQSLAYRRPATTEGNEGTGTGEGAGGAGGKTTADAATPRAGRGAPLTSIVQQDQFIQNYGQALDSLRAIEVPAIREQLKVRDVEAEGADGRIVFPQEGKDVVGMGAYEYVSWLFDERNDKTKGRVDKISRYLLKDASPAEVRRVNDAAQRLHVYLPADHPDRRSGKLEQLEQLADLADQLKTPFGQLSEGETDPVLYRPDPEDPKPYGFTKITALGDDSEKYDEYLKSRRGDDPPYFTGALERVNKVYDDAHDEQAGDEQMRKLISQQVAVYKGAADWVADRDERLKEGKPAGGKPPGMQDVSIETAEEIAQKKTESPFYKKLQATQEAWAFRHARNLLMKTRKAMGVGGDAPKPRGPERPALEASKRYRGRRVQVHKADSPLARALARRLARQPRGR